MWSRTPLVLRWGVPVVLLLCFPLLGPSDFLLRVGIDLLLYALLAAGLNIAVGWAGLLDLGYVAFYGFGAYSYAILSSSQVEIELPTIAAVPIAIVATALMGLLLGLASWRLLGDYLAIVTLFFAQIFLTLLINLDQVSIPGVDEPVDITGGPTGIAGLEPFALFGYELLEVADYYVVAAVALLVVVAGLALLNDSRIGRSWRALREDPLAAQLMGLPVRRLKLLAFVFGAAVAGFTGTIFAAVQVGVYPANFGLPILILVYAMVILGGMGSLGGVIAGAAVITIGLELLRSPEESRWLLYGVIVLILLLRVRPWRRAVWLLAATAAFGFAVRWSASAIWPDDLVAGGTGSDPIADIIGNWAVVAPGSGALGNYLLGGLLVMMVVLVYAPSRWRLMGLVPTLYLAVLVWENRLITDPNITRQLLLGAGLVALVILRPQGLFGRLRVERV
jgi:ABC-type branched-subunit amino acid transport system permease subunit